MTFAVPSRSKRIAPAPTCLAKGKSRRATRVVGSPSGFIGSGPRLGAATSPHPPSLQTKLKIGEPNDKFEQEADRVADHVMRMPDSAVRTAVWPAVIGQSSDARVANDPPRVCRECATEGDKLRRTLLGQHHATRISTLNGPIITRLTVSNQAPRIQRQDLKDGKDRILTSDNPGSAGADSKLEIEARIRSLRGHGKPLSRPERTFMEPRFGRYFHQARIHTGGPAAELASSVDAQAFTVGRDVVFGPGQHDPYTPEGLRLLAHELAHVVQQGAAPEQVPVRRKEGDPPDSVNPNANTVMSGCGGNGAAGLSPTALPSLARRPAEYAGPGGSQLPGSTLPTVTVGNFRNTGSTAASGENNCQRCPQILGVRTFDLRNGMELRGDISGHVADAQYDFKRTRETGVWLEAEGQVVWQEHHDGPGHPDDHWDKDEQLTPVNNHIYVEDTPGFKDPTFGYPNITQAVAKYSFVEWVNVRRGAGPWTKCSNDFEWHSVNWVAKVGSNWVRVAGKNEIEPGSITVGTGDAP